MPQITVRDAAEADVPALTAIKGEGSESLHRDRLQNATGSGFRYLVLLLDQELIGFACLVFVRPAHWSDAEDEGHLPQIVDLKVSESFRGRGYGSEFIGAIERMAAEAGHKQLYIGVEPLTNPRAYGLYQRLGYQSMQPEPYQKTWEFTDSAGNLHRGRDWVIDMVKQILN